MKKLLLTSAMICACYTPSAYANEISTQKNGQHDHSVTYGSSHAPIGVMGDHMHKKGEWMASYRNMHMDMSGHQNNGRSISPESIVTTQANRFAGTPGQPSTLRVVPTNMRMNMHMVGGMYGATDWLTVMVMANHLSKDMDHITYQGGAGTNVLGRFNTKTSGWGDTKVAGMFRLFEDDTHNIHVKTGVSIPTGSIDEDDDILAPNGATPTLRLPYAMQLGSGTYDFEPSLTYYGHTDRLGWGTQYNATFRIGENSENYTWGDKHSLSAWVSYDVLRNWSTSLRVTAETEEAIDGIDSSVVAPVQTADPDNYGGEHATISLGSNYVFSNGALKDHRLAFEVSVPVHQDRNGVQMERDWGFTLGWQKAF